MSLLNYIKNLYQRGKWSIKDIISTVTSYVRGTTREEDIVRDSRKTGI